jgi:transcriptional antiterminator RfaH
MLPLNITTQTLMHWYLIYTKPRQEKCALQNLEQQGYQCYMPLLPKEKLRQGALAVSDEPLFPRYLFINLAQDFMAKSWSPIRSTKGVSRLVRFGADPARVDDALVDLLRAHEAGALGEPERLFNPGERVLLTEGPFAGIEGIYQMADGDRRVMVLIELMTKEVAVSAGLEAVRKMLPAH